MEEQRIAKAHKLVVNNRKTSMVTGEISTALLIPVPLRQRKQEKISCPGCSGRRERCRDLEQRQ